MDRYWVTGGNGYYISTTNWSATSGGASGASAPNGSTHNVFIDSNSGSGTITIDDDWPLNNLTFDSSTIDIEFNGTGYNIGLYGSLYISAGAVFTNPDNNTISFYSISGTKTIETNGVVLPLVQLSSSGGTIELVDNLHCVGFRPYNVVFNSNNFDIYTQTFYTAGTSTRTLNLGTSTMFITGTGTCFNIENTTNLTFTGNHTIKFTDTSNNQVSLNLLTTNGLHTIWFDRGSSTGDNIITFDPNIVINTLKDTGTVSHTFDRGFRVIYVTNFDVSGNPSELINIISAGGTMYKNGGGVVSIDYVNLTGVEAGDTDTWYAGTHSIDNGGNTNWIFSDPPSTNTFGLFFGF